MINDLVEYFKNKKILILGFGREGISTYKLLRKYLKSQFLYIADRKENFEVDNQILKDDKNIKVISGEKYLENLQDYDVIMKSPGISFKGMDVSGFKGKIKSQLELLLEFFDNFTIGITGTKGKSTTSTLIHKVLDEQNVKNLFMGNIGIPAFDYIEEIQSDTKIVLEMSSHQLEFMHMSPNIAILLNVYEEHLDHYDSYQKYAEAKGNICKFQKDTDYIIYNYDNEIVRNLVQNAKSNKIAVTLNNNLVEDNIKLVDRKIYFNNKLLYDDNLEKRHLVGDFNLNNIMFVLMVSEILKLDLNKTINTIENFKGLEHRLEFVGKYDDVLYYDNAIATIPQSTIEAINALKNVNTLIIGGMDRGIDYADFIDFLNESDIENIICMPKTGYDIGKKLKYRNVYFTETLEEAVNTAKKVTKKGKSCLLSPAAASYEYFKNFEEKGDLFKKLVKKV